ncbi:CvfB family protein [Clostridium sp. Marseille-P2415]|uniref:CvfB family protein n=1 Tax=Clostridium sp. Marseille-P2415 TaxID=1805471 RepID=UPI00098856A7|nr:S1-like domain-containing RNA-binding protein [Clostridium sp. Marseille-P2415]
MIELGKMQTLTVQRVKEFGVYVGEEEGSEVSVLLPKKQVPEGAKPGDKVAVFIYKDSEDRLIATTAAPRLQVGETAVLNVKEVGKIGAFLDMGLEKDLLLPFKEQTHKVRPGEKVLAALYIDKSKRLAATMRVYSHMSNQSPYKKDDQVTGIIYEINDTLGAFVAVDNKFYGLIPKKEVFENYREGDEVTARVTKVREDGKLDLSPRQKAYIQMDADSSRVLEIIETQFDGSLPFTDKADPEMIKREFSMSKNAFKRAVGHLLKEGKIKISENKIEKIK